MVGIRMYRGWNYGVIFNNKVLGCRNYDLFVKNLKIKIMKK